MCVNGFLLGVLNFVSLEGEIKRGKAIWVSSNLFHTLLHLFCGSEGNNGEYTVVENVTIEVIIEAAVVVTVVTCQLRL